jgi:polysaccharide export outer membrane protein
MLKTRKNKLFRFVCMYLIASFALLEGSIAAPQLNNLSYGDIEAAKMLLKGGAASPEAGAVVPTQPISSRTSAATSEIEAQMSDGLPEGVVLKQFGYDVFTRAVSTFSPVIDAPVGLDYIVGPGDSFTVTLWGISEGIYNVDVNREGNITLPKAGVIHVAGLTFGDMKPYIMSKLARYYESINMSVAMSNVRTIRVYVLGEVAQPGSYTISALSTVYSALFSAGGPKNTGSMRNIQLRRNDRAISKIDLYDFLLKGDRGGDRALQSGDVIFVPLIGKIAAVTGNVKRPAIFEIGDGATLVNLLDLAGGVQTTAALNRVQIKRVIAHDKAVVIDKNLAEVLNGSSKFPVGDMDRVEVFPIYIGVENQVFLNGKVKQPGAYEFTDGMRVSDVLPSREALMREAYLDRAEIVRVSADMTKVDVLDFSLSEMLVGNSTQNKELKPFDRIMVYTEARSIETISLKGKVMRPGTYTIMKGEKLASVFKRAGGFAGDAFIDGTVFARGTVAMLQQVRMNKLIDDMDSKLVAKGPGDTAKEQENFVRARALLDRMRTVSAEGRVVLNIDKDLDKFIGSSSNIALEDGDSIYVPSTPSVINIAGEVYNSSTIAYEPGRNADYFLSKVGGPTKMADKGSIFIVKADGTVISNEHGYVGSQILGPGDTILVPPQYEFFDSYQFTLDMVDLLYKSATAAAMIKILIQ